MCGFAAARRAATVGTVAGAGASPCTRRCRTCSRPPTTCSSSCGTGTRRARPCAVPPGGLCCPASLHAHDWSLGGLPILSTQRGTRDLLTMRCGLMGRLCVRPGLVVQPGLRGPLALRHAGAARGACARALAPPQCIHRRAACAAGRGAPARKPAHLKQATTNRQHACMPSQTPACTHVADHVDASGRSETRAFRHWRARTLGHTSIP